VVEVIGGHGEMTAMREVVFGGSTRLETVYNRFYLLNLFVMASDYSVPPLGRHSIKRL
jgi:hypothetical protein